MKPEMWMKLLSGRADRTAWWTVGQDNEMRMKLLGGRTDRKPIIIAMFFAILWAGPTSPIFANEFDYSIVIKYKELLESSDGLDALRKDIFDRSEYICKRVEFLLRKECYVDEENVRSSQIKVLGNFQEDYSVSLKIKNNQIRIEYPAKRDIKFFNAVISIVYKTTYAEISDNSEINKYKAIFDSVCSGFGEALGRKNEMSDVNVKVVSEENAKFTTYSSECTLSTSDGKFFHGLTMKSNP